MELRYSIAARLGLLHSRRCPWSSTDTTPNNNWLGEYGELVACSSLRRRGHRILRQRFSNWRGGEIDIVSRQGDTLVFSEVKSRRSRHYAAPAYAVNREKRERIKDTAGLWLYLLWESERERPPYRFDIIEVILEGGELPQIRHIESAFRDTEKR